MRKADNAHVACVLEIISSSATMAFDELDTIRQKMEFTHFCSPAAPLVESCPSCRFRFSTSLPCRPCFTNKL